MSLCDRNCVILRRNRARCALYRKSLIYSIRNISEASINEVLPLMFEKVSRLLKYNFFGPQINIHIIYIYMDTNTDHFTLLALCMRQACKKKHTLSLSGSAFWEGGGASTLMQIIIGFLVELTTH